MCVRVCVKLSLSVNNGSMILESVRKHRSGLYLSLYINFGLVYT